VSRDSKGWVSPRRIRLPVSRQHVLLAQPTGTEDLDLLAASDPDTTVALELANQLTRQAREGARSGAVSDGAMNWLKMTVTDLDVLILRLRQWVIGDRIRSDVQCANPSCGRRVDISFSIPDYLAQHEPSEPVLRGGWFLDTAEEPGWFRLTQSTNHGKRQPNHNPNAEQETNLEASESKPAGQICFRLPLVEDQANVAGSPKRGSAEQLAGRCLRPAEAPAILRRKAEALMDVMAPALSRELKGVCPECGGDVTAFFDARRYCLRELRDRAAFIYQDVDLLARRYHWSEVEILALPHSRRASYAELARQEERVG